MKHIITLKFNKIPKNCNECPLQSSYEEEESFFGDGVVRYCPFGGDNFGSAINRPENCPIGTTIEVDEKDKPVNSPYAIDIKYFEKIAKDEDKISNFFEDEPTRNELVDKLAFPQTLQDLFFIAECCHYKMGWAYYQAKKLNIEIPYTRKKRYHLDGTVSYTRRRSRSSYYDDADYSDYDFGISPWGDS